MRRFIEEITVRDPDIASRIIHALEGKKEKSSEDAHSTIRTREPAYEVDLYEEAGGRDPLSNRVCECIRLKVFVRED